MSRDKELEYEKAKKQYWANIQKSYDLFIFNIYCICEITKIALEDEKKRKSKHLPTDMDKVFTAKLYENVIIQYLVSNRSINKKFEKLGFANTTDIDFFRKMYSEFAKEPPYKDYILSEVSREETVEILLELYRFCRRNEYFNEVMDDHFANWVDDKSLIIGTVKKVIKSLPMERENFHEEYYSNEETVKIYGESLFYRTYEEDKLLLEIIKPILKNWDHDRLAIVDMILLKMAVAEFLYFPTIPTKVTLNEYVDVSKQYSTEKSKEFINGVLDKILRQLEDEGKVKKEGRGLIG